MAHEFLSLAQAAALVHVDANELRHVAQRGEIDAQKRGDDWYFEHGQLLEWAQRNVLAASRRDLEAQHRTILDEQRRAHREIDRIADLFCPEAIDLSLQAKAKAGLLRDMTDLAAKSGCVYDDEALFHELVAREEAASTAIGESVALLHPRHHDPYLFERSFIAYGRSAHAIFFGAPNGEPTQHFFLICSTDHQAHLRILARLAVLAHGSDLITRLSAAESAEDVQAAVRACEEEYVK